VHPQRGANPCAPISKHKNGKIGQTQRASPVVPGNEKSRMLR
jgi:hypothetical protein